MFFLENKSQLWLPLVGVCPCVSVCRLHPAFQCAEAYRYFYPLFHPNVALTFKGEECVPNVRRGGQRLPSETKRNESRKEAVDERPLCQCTMGLAWKGKIE